MIEYNRRIFGHGVMHGIMPESIRSDFEHVTAIGCTTRAVNGLNLKIPFCKKSLLASAPSFTVPTAWNTLNLEIKKVQKARSFKKLLQKDYFDRYRAEPSCSRTDCYSCAGLSRGHGRSVGAGRIWGSQCAKWVFLACGVLVGAPGSIARFRLVACSIFIKPMSRQKLPTNYLYSGVKH